MCLPAQACTPGGESRRKRIRKSPGRNRHGFVAGENTISEELQISVLSPWEKL